MLDVFWELNQQGNIDRAERKAMRAEGKVDDFAGELEHLSRKVERLSLGCQAMWEMLRDKTDLTEEDILLKMEEIDLRDGELDGRIGGQVLVCPKCRRKSNSRRNSCLYCGIELQRPHVFE